VRPPRAPEIFLLRTTMSLAMFTAAQQRNQYRRTAVCRQNPTKSHRDKNPLVCATVFELQRDREVPHLFCRPLTVDGNVSHACWALFEASSTLASLTITSLM